MRKNFIFGSIRRGFPPPFRRLKTMTLSAEEFIRRFLLHVLPNDFHRIRHFGFLACRHRQQKLALCRRLLNMAPAEPCQTAPDSHDLFESLTGTSLLQCPACRRGRLFVVARFEPGEPPPPEDFDSGTITVPNS